MALTLPRWLAAAIAGALMIAAAVFSREPRSRRVESPREQLIQAERRASGAASRAAERLRALVLRDSVRAAVARVAPSSASRTITGGGLSKDMLRYDRVLAVRMDLVRAQQRSGAIDVALILDTVSSFRSSSLRHSFVSVTHVLPSSPGERCLAIVRQAPRKRFEENYPRYWTSWLTSVGTAARLLGPCGFYEAFGSPGRGVDAWLTNGAWRYGSSAAMRNSPTRSWADEYFYWYDPIWANRAGWPLRRYVTSDGYRCASGDLPTCRALVLDPNADSQLDRLPAMTRDRIVPVTNTGGDFDFWYTSFGPAQPWLLSDMVSELGPERFRRFWTSDKPAAEAFAQAAGEDIGVWTARWTVRRYGVNKRGPSPDSSTATWSLLLAFGGLSVALVNARRRQMA